MLNRKTTCLELTAACTVLVFILAAKSAFAGAASSSTIIYDAANGKVWNVNPDSDTVTAIDGDAVTPTKLSETAVGKNPRTLAKAPDGTIWVVNQGDATISVLTSSDGTVTATISLPRASMPYGVAFAPDGSAAYVTLQGSGQLLKLDPVARTILATIDIGPSPRGVAVTSDSARIFVTRFISPQDNGEVREVTASTFTLAQTITLAEDPGPDSLVGGRGIPNYISSITISPDGTRAWVPSKKDNTLRGLARDGVALNFENTVRTIVSQIILSTSLEDLGARVDFDNSDMAVAVQFDVAGTYAFFALQGSNRVQVFDTVNKVGAGSIDTGLAPQGLALNTAASRLYVQNFMSRTVSVFDVSNLASITSLGTINAVSTELLAADVLLGKQIFYNARDPRMSEVGYISCASCHVDGGQDGRVWDFTSRGEGFRNSVMLQGRGGVNINGPVHWTANFDEIQDFENDIRFGFGGTGFMSDTDFNAGTRSDPLGDTKAGFSADLDALAAYVTSLTTVSKSPYRDYTSSPGDPAGQLTADAEAGKLLFNSLNCVSCHVGSAFSDSGSGPFHDVGTIKATSGQRRNQTLTGFDTPTLKGVWETAPYLHDGSAATLLEVLTTQNTSGLHGSTGSLSAAQRDQLVAYLLQIDEDEPGNTQPTVSIVSPITGTSFNAPSSVSITADASDDNSVAKVEFFEGANKIGEATSAPYTVSFNSPAQGSYTITAVATDNLTATRTSAPIMITIKAEATVTLGNLTATFDGTAKAVTATTIPPNITGTITYNGSLLPPTAPGVYDVVATITDVNYFGGATGTLTIFPILEIGSAPAAAPNPSIAGQAVLFTATSNGIGIVWDWTFGDGDVSTTNDGTATHVYTAKGVYTATLTVSQPDGQTAEASIAVTVNAPDTDGDGVTDDLDGDDDNDGVSDINELADGTDPLNSGSAASIPMPVQKISAGLNFARADKDALSISGTLPSVPAILDTTGMVVIVDAGGARFEFTLNGKGQGKVDRNKLTLKLKPGRRGENKNTEFLGGDIAYKASVRGSFNASLADEGLLSQDAKDQSASVLVTVLFNGRVYSQLVGGEYSAKAGKSGKFKN